MCIRDRDDLNVMEKEAMLRIVREKLEEYGKLNQTAGKDFLLTLTSIAGLEELLHQIAVQFPWDYEARQKILECTFLSAMYETVLQLLLTETEVYRIKKEMCIRDSLIMDEPTRGIDVGAKYEIYQIMIDLAKQGKGIIMISSEMPELIGMSNRILVMCNGHITGEVKDEEATQERIMSYATKF